MIKIKMRKELDKINRFYKIKTKPIHQNQLEIITTKNQLSNIGKQFLSLRKVNRILYKM